MANPLPNENEFYARIENEKMTISVEIWDLLYNYIGDDLSAINLLCQYHLAGNQAIPIADAKKILLYTRHIKDIINKITLTAKTDFAFPEFAQGIPLDPALREMLTHYIGNDIYMINLIVGDAVDPVAPGPLSLENTGKIIGHCRSIKVFMDRLRKETMPGADIRPDSRIDKEPIAHPQELPKEEIFSRIRKLLAQEFNLEDKQINLDTRFKEDLGADSISAMQVIILLEKEFGFEMPDEDEDKILSVGDAVEYVFRKLQENPPK
jgi:acyl carrier protein